MARSNDFSKGRDAMPRVKGIAFDLFGTLVLQEQFSFDQCLEALYRSLQASGFRIEKDTFIPAYRQVNRQLMEQTEIDGRETHNRTWVAGALESLGYTIDPGDARIDAAVDAYFSPFIDSCQLIPGTAEMLASLRGRYRLGLVSNFTHPPALAQILVRVGLEGVFDEIIISGQFGIRKPHPAIFRELTRLLALVPAEIMFVGDELQADIAGAHNAGLQTVWMTYRQRLERPSPLGQFLGVAEAKDGIQPHHVVANWVEFLALCPVLDRATSGSCG